MRGRLKMATLTLTLIAPAVGAAQPATLLLLDRNHLQASRARVKQGDPALNEAVAALVRDADRALAQKPMSVMDKGVAPPSGDKHDYMSQAPYWWPDPSKPDGKPYIRKDGERNPEISRITDRDNLARLMGAVPALALAFYYTGREDYAAHAARLLRVWFLEAATRMNPHLLYGQSIPGVNEGRGIGIIETRGLPELLDGVLLLRESSAWTEADHRGLESWMRAYLVWLLESNHGREEAKNGNNHETFYDVQTLGLALFTGQRDIARRIAERGRERIARQIEPDGRMPRELERTRGWSYSAMNLDGFVRLARLAEAVGVDLWKFETRDGRSIKRAVDFLLPFARREREWPFQEITAFEPGAIHGLLRRAAVGWKDPSYREIATKIGGGSARLDLTVP